MPCAFVPLLVTRHISYHCLVLPCSVRRTPHPLRLPLLWLRLTLYTMSVLSVLLLLRVLLLLSLALLLNLLERCKRHGCMYLTCVAFVALGPPAVVASVGLLITVYVCYNGHCRPFVLCCLVTSKQFAGHWLKARWILSNTHRFLLQNCSFPFLVEICGRNVKHLNLSRTQHGRRI